MVKLSVVGEGPQSDKRDRRRHGIEISAFSTSSKLDKPCLILVNNGPNSKKTTVDMFYPYKKVLHRPKNHLTLLSL
jgi:hypothetical protein